MKWRIFVLSAFLCLAACGDDDSGSISRPDGKEYLPACKTDSTDTCEYGELVDERDGQTYKTVKIGEQVWMAENLNYAYTGVPYFLAFYVNNDSVFYTSDSTSWCYGNDPANCAKYGRLYTWATAMDSAGTWSTSGKGCGLVRDFETEKQCTPTYPVRGICPEGWHLPSEEEWNTLFDAIGPKSGKKLKSTSGWYEDGNGTDDYGFSGLPAGWFDREDFIQESSFAYFWVSTVEPDSYDVTRVNLFHDLDVLNMLPGGSFYGYSVRCIKDSQTE